MFSTTTRRAFTLIELIVVIVVLGILAAIAIVGYQAVIARSELSTIETRNASVAREVAAILAFGDGTTPAAALVEAVGDLPPAAAAPGVFAAVVNGYDVGADVAVEDRNDFGHATAGSGEFVFMSRFDPATVVSCWVSPSGAAHGCATIKLAAEAPTVGEILDGEHGDVDLGFVSVPGGDGGTPFEPDPTTTTTTLPPVPSGETIAVGKIRAPLATATAVGPDGTVYIVGDFSGTITFGDTTLESAGDNDVYVAAFDQSGVVLWAARTGSTQGDRGNDVAVTADAVYVVGQYRGAPTGFAALAGAAPGTRIEGFVAALDPSTGTPLWAAKGGGTGDDYAYAVAATDTTLYVGGAYASSTPSGFVTGADSPNGSGGYDAYVAKLDPSDGTPMWVAVTGSNGGDAVTGLAATDTGVFVTGEYRASGPGPTGFAAAAGASNGSSYADVFVAALDPADGTPLWADRTGGPNAETAPAIAATDTGVFVAGFYRGTPTGFAASLGQAAGGYNDNDAFVAAFDPATGNMLWVERHGANGRDEAYDVTATATAVYVAGVYSSQNPTGFAADAGPTAGAMDAFVAALNPTTGATLWADRTGGTGHDYAFGVAVSANAVHVVGTYQQTPTGFAADAGPADGTEVFVAAIGR